MPKRRQKRGEGYSQHTINIADADWNSIEQEAKKKGVSNSRIIADMIKTYRDKSQIELKSFLNWFDDKTDEQDWGNHMWVCQSFPYGHSFLLSPFHMKRVQIDYVIGKSWDRHTEESEKFNRRFLAHILQPHVFSCHEIYALTEFREIVDGRYSVIDAQIRINGVERMIEYIEKSQTNIALSKKPLNLNFRLHQTDEEKWGYIWGEYIYFETDDQRITEGLHQEFYNIQSHCEIAGRREVVKFLQELIEEIKDRAGAGE